MENLLEIGQIVNTWGLRGEVKIIPWCDYPEIFEELNFVLIDGQEYEIETVKYHKNFVILKLSGINSIESAELYRNKIVMVNRELLGELPDGTYYICDLIGCVVKTTSGQVLGKLDDVIKTGSNDVYSVRNEEGKQVLIPVIDEVIMAVDIENKSVVIEPIKGLLD